MEIRRLVLSALLLSAGSLPGVAAIRAYPLDERIAYTVQVSVAAPTTCLFPGAITALESAHLSTKAEDAPPVLLSHQPGTNFFSVRALHPEAAAAVNVIHRGRVYVLTFRSGDEADRAVSFFTPAEVTDSGVTPSLLRGLLERARNHALMAAQYPALAETVDRAAPRSVNWYPGFTVTLEEVFRFDPEDTLVFQARIRNATATPLRFDPEHLAVRVGPSIYAAAITDAAGEVPAMSHASVWFAVRGAPGGGRANLSVHNAFSVLVARLP
ncbi:MAG: hypothetical protein Q8M02_13250 [Candidatus Didemnitutus sp.]|nr:hypothetical protein [Candidatus Didemnitutus sp.]